MGHSGEEFWEARGVENQLLRVVGPCGFTLSPNGVLATFTFPVFSVSSPRGSSLGFLHTGGGGEGGTRMCSGCPQRYCSVRGTIASRKGLLQEGRFVGGVSFGRWWFLCRCLKEPPKDTAQNTRGSKIRGWISEGGCFNRGGFCEGAFKEAL